MWSTWGFFWLIFRFFKSPFLEDIVKGIFKWSWISSLGLLFTLLFTDVNNGKDCKNKHPAKELKGIIGAHALTSHSIFFFMFRKPAMRYIEVEMYLRNEPDYEPYI